MGGWRGREEERERERERGRERKRERKRERESCETTTCIHDYKSTCRKQTFLIILIKLPLILLYALELEAKSWYTVGRYV